MSGVAGTGVTTFFISYNSADAQVAEEVATALRAAGQTVRFAGWELGLGGDIALWMTEALDDCDRLVAIVSPDYLKPQAKYSAIERAAIIWHDIDGKNSAIIPLVVRPSTIPRIIASRVRFDLSEDQTITSFVEALLKPMGGPPPPEQPHGSSVKAAKAEPDPSKMPVPPNRKTLFVNLPAGRTVVGRDEAVAGLRARLIAAEDNTVAVTNSGAVLRGQGGLGKSTLARRYAEVHGGDYDGVIWVEALTRQAIIEGLVALCAHFDQPVPDAPQAQHAQAVLGKIAASGQSWLFIYDNVEAYADLKGLLPPRGAHLIVTTRQGEGWPGFEVMPLEKLGFETETSPAVTLLMNEAGRTEGAAEARALAEDLGGLPLALVVAGSLIRSTGESFAAYRERLSEILAHAPDNEDYPTSVLGAVQLSYDQLSGDAKIVADLCAWWAAEGLEPALLSEASQGWDWEDRRGEGISEEMQTLAAEPGRVRAGFAELTSRSLMERGDGHWSMHRMTAAALRHLQAERADVEMAKAAAALLAAVYPGGAEHDVNNSKEWPLCARLTPHVRALWASGVAPETEAMRFLFNQAAIYLGKVADFPGNLEMARASFALKQKQLPEAHRDIAVGLDNLGMALMRAGELAQAEAHLARAVALHETHRPDSMVLAGSYDLHGRVLYAQALAGNTAALVRSLRRFQQALALYRRLAGRDSEATARALNNLAVARNFQGRTAAAGRLSAAALAIRRRVLDPGDANLGSSLMNTGAYWLKSGSAARAEPLLREALELRQTVFAAQPQHPETRLAADWLISCLLTLARVGDRPEVLKAEARALCGQYGYDFAEREAVAR